MPFVVNSSGAASGQGVSVLGVDLTCPPFCPGAVASPAAVPFRQSAGSQMTLATLPEVGAASQPQPLAAAYRPGDSLRSTSEGVYYALACSATGVYADPQLGACSNATDPSSYLCAFGSGDSCKPCPASALCPGGTRELRSVCGVACLCDLALPPPQGSGRDRATGRPAISFLPSKPAPVLILRIAASAGIFQRSVTARVPRLQRHT